MFDPNQETILSADASSFSLGLCYTNDKTMGPWDQQLTFLEPWLPQSKDTYGQIEKEALALTWACKRLADYLEGLQFHIETDHKTLVLLLGTKHLPIRIQHFRMRLMHFLFTISYVPGKHLITADALSRAPITSFPESEEELHKSVDMYVCAILSTLPAIYR